MYPVPGAGATGYAFAPAYCTVMVKVHNPVVGLQIVVGSRPPEGKLTGVVDPWGM